MEWLRPIAVPTELAGQGLIHVELRGYSTAAVEVQVVLGAQLAVLTQGWLAGRTLLFKVTALCESKESVASNIIKRPLYCRH